MTPCVSQRAIVDQHNLLKPMSSGLLAPDVMEVEMIVNCSALNCEDPSQPDQQCVEKAVVMEVSDHRTPWQCSCENHEDYNVQMSGRAIVETSRKLLLGVVQNTDNVVEYQYENWAGSIYDRISLIVVYFL